MHDVLPFLHFILIEFIILFAGALPYSDLTNSDVMAIVLNGEVLDCPELCPSSLYTLMQQCWLMDADSRISFNELAQRLRGWKPKQVILDRPSTTRDMNGSTSVQQVMPLKRDSLPRSYSERLRRHDSTASRLSQVSADALFQPSPSPPLSLSISISPLLSHSFSLSLLRFCLKNL